MSNNLKSMEVELREITDRNRTNVLAVAVAPNQERFVGTVAGALQEAAENPEGKPWARAVYAAGQVVGFVMLSWDVAPDPPHIIGPWFLWKLLIDHRYQRRGLGREVVRLVGDIVRGEGAAALLTSYTEGEGDPGPFYEKLGFIPTGDRDDNDEVILSLDLGAAPG